VLPTGWSWAFRIVQKLHESICDDAGFAVDRRLVAGWFEKHESFAMPYCDNLTVCGSSEASSVAGLMRLLKAFQVKGFVMHEVALGEITATVLGGVVHGLEHFVHGKDDKIALLRGVFLWLSSGPKVTGQVIEKVLGHFIYVALPARALLSVPRALYAFIKDSYLIPQCLWRSAAYESKLIAALLPLASCDLDRAWHPRVDASDASLTGCAAVSSCLDPAAVKEMG